jgi:hypothetical protein
MAGFNPQVQKTNDPTYLGSSQGTDRASLQPLASVPELSTKYVQPEHKTDQSSGTLAKGLGDVGGAALTLTDQVIQQNATDTLRKGIDEIRDSFGVAAAADQSTGIAKAVGAGGAEGVSLAQADPNAGQPIAINRLGNRIEGLTESYKQGGLSNSAYYAKLEAYVREVKAQFPGYGEIIDSKVANIVGTTPANALRSSLLNDVTALQNKVAGQNDKWTTFERSNADAIYRIWPNYEAMKQDGSAPNRAQVEQAVGRIRAREATEKSQMSTLALEEKTNSVVSARAESLAIQKAADIASTISLGTTNTMGLKTPADFQTLLQDISSGKRGPLTPDQKAEVTSSFAILKQQYGIQYDKFANSPLNQNTTETVASKIGSPSKNSDIRARGMQNLADIEDGLVNEKYGTLVATANWNKASAEAGENSILRKDRNAALIVGSRKIYGDQGLLAMYNNSPQMVSTAIEGLRQAGWAEINKASDGTKPQSEGWLRQTLDMFKKESNNDGSLVKAHITDAKTQIVQPEKFADPGVSKRAVQYLFGEGNRTLIDSFGTKNQVNVFNDLVSPTVTKSIGKMDKTSQETYFNWANDGFQSVYNTQADNINQTADNYKINGNLTLKYNPDSAAFYYEGGRGGAAAITQAANSKLAGFNSAVNTMKDVWKAQGKDATDELYRMLPIIGIEGGSPVFKAIQTEFQKKQPKAE